MTRKHFALIAKVLASQARYFRETSEFNKLVLDFADELAETNPQFDRQKFLDACGLP